MRLDEAAHQWMSRITTGDGGNLRFQHIGRPGVLAVRAADENKPSAGILFFGGSHTIQGAAGFQEVISGPQVVVGGGDYQVKPRYGDTGLHDDHRVSTTPPACQQHRQVGGVAGTDEQVRIRQGAGILCA